MLTIQKSFDKNAFSNIIKFDYEVDWNSMNKGFSADLNTEIYEFDIISKINFTPIKGQKTKSIYYKIIATMTENGCVFYVAKFADGVKNTAIKSSFIATANYSGKIYLLNKEEEIISAKKYFNGTFVGNIMVSDYKVNSYMWLDCTTIAITHYSTSYVEVGGQYFYTTRVTGTTYETICTGGGGDSGGGGYGDSGGGGSTDQYEDAVVDPNVNPCDQIKIQNNDPNYIAKIEYLKGKTGLMMETGFAQKTDGTFKQLQNGSGGTNVNSMDCKIESDIVGYIHSHLDPYETGEYTADGDPKMNAPIPIFSPADVGKFLELLINAQTNNIPIANVYGTMVSSSGTYTLSFSGNIADVRTNFDWVGLKEIYKIAINENGKELGFLKFINDNVGINGISLYKIKKDGTSEKKSLDQNLRLATTPCQ